MRESRSLRLELRAASLAPWQAPGGDGPPPFLVTPLPRFDGRSLAFPHAETAPSTLTLHYWRPGEFFFPQVALAPLALALEKAEAATTALFCQRKLRRALSLAAGGAEQIACAVREHLASVIVVDNLERLLPRIHGSPGSRLAVKREILGELRRLMAGFGQVDVRPIHHQTESQARRLLEAGLVDKIEEVRP